jgi:hypothetical protein
VEVAADSVEHGIAIAGFLLAAVFAIASKMGRLTSARKQVDFD